MKISGFALLICLLMCSAIQGADYKVINTLRNSTTLLLDLTYTGTDEYYVKPTSPIVKNLQFVFHTLAFYDFYFKIVDSAKKRFEVPTYGAFPSDPLNGSSFPITASAVTFTYTENPFNFKITRRSNNAVLFSTEGKNIIFSDYYLEIGTEIDSQYVFGLGERLVQGFRVQDGKWSMFNRDRGEEIDTGVGIQTYGYYPFYLLKEKNSEFHVSYFRGSNALDVIKESKDGKHSFVYKTIGGVIDFRFFLGQADPEATI